MSRASRLDSIRSASEARARFARGPQKTTSPSSDAQPPWAAPSGVECAIHRVPRGLALRLRETSFG